MEVAELGEHFAAVLCAATGAERAAMAIILALGARPAAKHRHHEVLKLLKSRVGAGLAAGFDETVISVAELMGHLTMMRYKYELGGKLVTPR